MQRKIIFAECIICGQKESFDYELEGWDFSIDIDALEPDEDAGVRGEHTKCKKGLEA